MTSIRVLLSRLRASLSLRPADRDLSEDIEAHLDLLANEFQQKGMSGADARLAARREFGGVAAVQETYREQRRLPAIDMLAQDVRFAVRTMFRAPTFTTIAVLTLALGIGANTAIFQVLYTLVIKPLPVRDPAQLVELKAYQDGREQGFSLPLFREMAARQTVLDGMFVWSNVQVRELIVDGRSPAGQVDGARLASGGYFRLLGTEPQIGRLFTEADDQPSAAPVAVISDAFWRREFGSSAEALGRVLRINGIHVTVIGVTRREFFGESVGTVPDLWIPLILVSQVVPAMGIGPGTVWLWPMARLPRDISVPHSEAALSALYEDLKPFSIYKKNVTDYGVRLLPAPQGAGSLHEEFGRPLWILMGIVGLVALLACCNLANLLLARATARTHEIGVRLAVGATRPRLIRQMLTESAMLAVFGGGLGFLLAGGAATALVGLAMAGQDLELSIEPDSRVAAFTTLVSMMAVFVFGLVPALAATRTGVSAAIQGNRRTQSAGRQRHLTARTLVIAQITLSLILVAGASLLTRSFWNLTHQDFGYQPERVLTAYLDFDFANFKRFNSPVFRDTLFNRVRAIPGIRNASLSMGGPMGNLSDSEPFALPERMPGAGDDVSLVRVYPYYFETMAIPILRGRPITADDRKGARNIAVISQTTASRFFGGDNPIGRVFSYGSQFDANRAVEIVGVARDVRYRDPRGPFTSLVYVPMEQIRAFSVPEIVLTADGDQTRFTEPLRNAVRGAAPGLDIWGVKTLSETVIVRLRRERLLAWLSAAFGVLALLLAGVGLYGVVSYRVERRTQEIGIRLALGATQRRVRAMLLREVLQLVGIGLAAGGVATVALTGLLRSILFELSPRDPATLISAAVVLTSVGLLAGFIPARRASRLDPMIALRTE